MSLLLQALDWKVIIKNANETWRRRGLCLDQMSLRIVAHAPGAWISAAGFQTRGRSGLILRTTGLQRASVSRLSSDTRVPSHSGSLNASHVENGQNLNL